MVSFMLCRFLDWVMWGVASKNNFFPDTGMNWGIGFESFILTTYVPFISLNFFFLWPRYKSAARRGLGLGVSLFKKCKKQTLKVNRLLVKYFKPAVVA